MARPANPTVVRGPDYRPCPPEKARPLTPEEIALVAELRAAEKVVQRHAAAMAEHRALAKEAHRAIDRILVRMKIAKMTAAEKVEMRDALLSVGPGPEAPTEAGTPGGE